MIAFQRLAHRFVDCPRLLVDLARGIVRSRHFDCGIGLVEHICRQLGQAVANTRTQRVLHRCEAHSTCTRDLV